MFRPRLVILVSLLALASVCPVEALAWPADSDWEALYADDSVVTDGEDVASDGDSLYDIVGDVHHPAVSWFADDTYFYLRMRLNRGNVLVHGANGHWGYLLDVSGGDSVFEFGISIGDSPTSGFNALLCTAGAATDEMGNLLATLDSDVVDHDTDALFGEDNDRFLDLRLDRSLLDGADILYANTSVRILAATTTSHTYLGALTSDRAAFDDSRLISPTAPVGSALSDPVCIDCDSDGLTFFEEQRLGTDPESADTDADGLSDGSEVDVWGTDPARFDTDLDGLDDSFEISIGSDPRLADTDADGLSDADEIREGTSPTRADTDSDGLSDPDEIRAGTDPNRADTDADGIGDAAEVECGGHDPADRDDDGLPDALEGITDTDADGLSDFCDQDADGDGRPDRAEGTGDADCDGIANYVDANDSDGSCEPEGPASAGDTASDSSAGTDPESEAADPGAEGGAMEPSGGGCSVVPGRSGPSAILFGLLGGLLASWKSSRKSTRLAPSR